MTGGFVATVILFCVYAVWKESRKFKRADEKQTRENARNKQCEEWQHQEKRLGDLFTATYPGVVDRYKGADLNKLDAFVEVIMADMHGAAYMERSTSWRKHGHRLAWIEAA